MTRTLSVAGTLAILLVALWIGQVAKGTAPAVGARMQATIGVAAAAPPATAIAETAVEDLAAWPIWARH